MMSMHVRVHPVVRSLLAAVMLCFGGCRLPWQSVIEYPCHQTFEFGNNGCAGLVVIVEPPAEPLPKSFYYMLHATPAYEHSTVWYGSADFYDTVPPAAPLRLIRWGWSPGDTASVWLSAVILDRTRRMKSSGQYLTAAIDSVLHVVRFSAIGDRPWVDTVRFTLKRP